MWTFEINFLKKAMWKFDYDLIKQIIKVWLSVLMYGIIYELTKDC